MTESAVWKFFLFGRVFWFFAGITIGVSIGILIAASGLLTWNTKTGNYGYFVSNPEVKVLDDGETIQLISDFVYVDPLNNTWIARSGSFANGASIPRAFWSIVGGPLSGKYRDSAIIHDVACEEMQDTWENVHLAFYWGCRSRGVSEIQANMMYAAVYHFGPRWESTIASETREVIMADGSPTFVPVQVKLARPISLDREVTDEVAKKLFEKIQRQNLSLKEIQELALDELE